MSTKPAIKIAEDLFVSLPDTSRLSIIEYGEVLYERGRIEQETKAVQYLESIWGTYFIGPAGPIEDLIESHKRQLQIVKPPVEITPIPMIMYCPECHKRHIDRGEFATKIHHTHSCQKCGLTWRPAVVPTVGVQFLPGFKDPLYEG